MVGTIMDYKDEGANPSEVGSPAKHHECDGGVVMNKHLPEILPLDIKKLADAETPVEG